MRASVDSVYDKFYTITEDGNKICPTLFVGQRVLRVNVCGTITKIENDEDEMSFWKGERVLIKIQWDNGYTDVIDNDSIKLFRSIEEITGQNHHMYYFVF